MKSVKFISLTLVMTSLFFAISLIFLTEISMYSKQIIFINNMECKYISIYEGDAKIEKEYKLLNSYYSIYSNGKKIKADILMQNDGQSIFGEVVLKNNEIVVSENFLLNGYKIGDILYVTSPISDEKIEFVIVDTISACYGITNESLDKTKFMVIFGYGKNIFNNSIPNIAFINDEDISSSNIKIQKFIQTNDIIKYSKYKIKPLIFVDIIIKISICISYIAIFLMLFKYIIRRHIINGRSIKNIMFTSYIKYCLPLIMSILMSVLFTAMYSIFILSYLSLYVFVFAITTLFIFLMIYINLIIKIRRNLG